MDNAFYPKQESTPQKSILLGGEDVMEEDEAAPIPSGLLRDHEAFEGSSQELSGLVGGGDELISKIIVPSPYPHHATGATSSRFRNALNRVTTDPLSDVEAWQALINEANACYRAIIHTLHSVDADTHAKLDWMESCYGALLKHFPYASSYYVTIAEMLMAQSARLGEEDGPLMDYGTSQRAQRCEAKLERIFRDVLGVQMDGTPVPEKRLGGMCTSSVELWLLYVRKRIRDANRRVTMSIDEKVKLIRDWTINAYEEAIKHTSFVFNNHLVWKQYLGYVKAWIPNPITNTDHALAQAQMIRLRSVYQRLVTHPMTGLDQLWQEYEAFERGQSEALAVALVAEYAPKYQHARTIYLERNRIYNVADLQMNRLATSPVDVSDEDYAPKMTEENRLLTLWKKRCSYERTNPERLPAEDLVVRVRQAYKEMICIFTLYPEAWNMWSSWELLLGSTKETARMEYAIDVLKLAQHHIPDCTLLAYSEAQIIEVHTKMPENCMKIMEAFLERSPNTLGYVLYQQMVRRYRGINAARQVFSKARRVLRESASGEAAMKEEVGEEAKDGDTELNHDGTNAATTNSGGTEDNGKRRSVTNRLEVGIGAIPKKQAAKAKDIAAAAATALDTHDADTDDAKKEPGPITWQLYASHAAMEHRLNLSPAIAARVYELGLRKHLSFLTKAPYVIRYAQLLMELQDTDNLRALLTRAVAACEKDTEKAEASAALWDISLQFEAIMCGTDPENLKSLKSTERRRHASLLGPEIEDVATGGLASNDQGVGIGSQKTPLSEQLIRTEGYDLSSAVVNGMTRMVNVLEVMGLWGSDGGNNSMTRLSQSRAASTSTIEKDELEGAGGKSDASFQRRLRFQYLVASGRSVESVLMADGSAAAAGATGGGGTRSLLSARERLQQAGTAAVAAAAAASQPSGAVAVAIQQSPEWLRPLLLLLPASRMRSAMLSKAPPHMIEMALSTLKNNQLPPERPMDGGSRNYGKRKLESGDSSDEDGSGMASGGYGNQFRARQRSRQRPQATMNQANGPGH